MYDRSASFGLVLPRAGLLLQSWAMLSRFPTRRHGPLIVLVTAVVGLAMLFLQEVARGLGWL